MNGDGVVLEVVAEFHRMDGPSGLAPSEGILKIESVEAQHLLGKRTTRTLLNCKCSFFVLRSSTQYVLVDPFHLHPIR